MSAPVRYGALDRLLHRVAFSSVPLQKVLADVEDRVFSVSTDPAPPPRPVFITALPRAGTTLLLHILAAAPDFATQCYRDMPFLFIPLLWSRFPRRFRMSAERRERAHGDGVEVGFDSPEAFEEALWHAFWPEKFARDHIEPWQADDRKAEFEDFFFRHMRKVIAVRGEGRTGRRPHRYLSKNNGNIARLALLPVLFPDCRIVVPVRNPFSHARSLQRQHHRFRKLHASDPFARRYMTALGHFEFGADLRPIGFAPRTGDPDSIGFWLHYWLAVHRAIGDATAENIVMVDYDLLCADPSRSLHALCDALDVDVTAGMRAAAGTVRRPTGYRRHRAPGTGPVLAASERAFEELRRRAVNAPVNAGTGIAR